MVRKRLVGCLLDRSVEQEGEDRATCWMSRFVPIRFWKTRRLKSSAVLPGLVLSAFCVA